MCLIRKTKRSATPIGLLFTPSAITKSISAPCVHFVLVCTIELLGATQTTAPVSHMVSNCCPLGVSLIAHKHPVGFFTDSFGTTKTSFSTYSCANKWYKGNGIITSSSSLINKRSSIQASTNSRDLGVTVLTTPIVYVASESFPALFPAFLVSGIWACGID